MTTHHFFLILFFIFLMSLNTRVFTVPEVTAEGTGCYLSNRCDNRVAPAHPSSPLKSVPKCIKCVLYGRVSVYVDVTKATGFVVQIVQIVSSPLLPNPLCIDGERRYTNLYLIATVWLRECDDEYEVSSNVSMNLTMQCVYSSFVGESMLQLSSRQVHMSCLLIAV